VRVMMVGPSYMGVLVRDQVRRPARVGERIRRRRVRIRSSFWVLDNFVACSPDTCLDSRHYRSRRRTDEFMPIAAVLEFAIAHDEELEAWGFAVFHKVTEFRPKQGTDPVPPFRQLVPFEIGWFACLACPLDVYLQRGTAHWLRVLLTPCVLLLEEPWWHPPLSGAVLGPRLAQR
jgi:hypothetical protein